MVAAGTLVMAIAHPAHAEPNLKPGIFAIVIGQTLDSFTTHLALAAPNTHEAVLTQNPWVNDAILAGIGSAQILAMAHTHGRKRRIAILVGVATGALHVYIANRNLNTLREANRGAR
jgi:xanthine/uracil permease